MTAQIDGDGAKAVAGEQGRNSFPGTSGLPAAVRENDRHSIACAFDGGGNGMAGLTLQLDRVTFHEDFLL
jgi:hypothetical protein